ncbi:uncharacterized sodium-dependent transporter YocR-like [Sycon ciliatum]|uniref:uncharacterized sodium-dependent transporter YocR-like n=1 Tax=Sycon ciliatum TaxID=27933 RepID=UPI0020AE41F4|eukprot:scpid46169/ scgid20877/ Uncharacterized sodium-dependent transporter HI_0736
MAHDPPPMFSNTIALCLSCLGCVVGTGNIWRFPRIVANNAGDTGGLVFLIVWFMFLMLWSIPVILIEYSVGRFTRRGPVESFGVMLGKGYRWVGGWVFMVNLGICCYYSVVLGWCMYYFIHVIAFPLPETVEASTEIFNSMSNSYYPVLTHCCSVLFVALIISRSVSTFEKVNMIFVPILLAIVFGSFIYAMTLQDAIEGVKYLFRPEWSQFGKARLWVDAISQNAWDTGAGAGLFIVYSIYMPRKSGVVKFGCLIPLCNNVVSLVSAMTTMATVFHVQVAKEHLNPDEPEDLKKIVKILSSNGEANTGLTFIWIPTLYNLLPGGRALAVFFFLCLVFAGLSSMVAQMELVIRTLEDFGAKRKYALPCVAVVVALLGLPSSLNINVLVNQDFVWGFGLILSGMCLIFLVFWYGTHVGQGNGCLNMMAGANRFRKEVVNEYGMGDWKLPVLWAFLVTFINPIEAAGMIGWWVYDQASQSDPPWWAYESETLFAAVSQWFFWALVLISLNIFFGHKFSGGSSSYHQFDMNDDDGGDMAAGTAEVTLIRSGSSTGKLVSSMTEKTPLAESGHSRVVVYANQSTYL